MLAKYLLNKYDKLATTHLLWTPWGFLPQCDKVFRQQGPAWVPLAVSLPWQLPFSVAQPCSHRLHNHAPRLLFFPPHPSQECRTEIRKTAASLPISGNSKETFWKPHLTLWHGWEGTFCVVHVGTSQSDYREGFLYLHLSSSLWRFAFFCFMLIDIRK